MRMLSRPLSLRPTSQLDEDELSDVERDDNAYVEDEPLPCLPEPLQKMLKKDIDFRRPVNVNAATAMMKKVNNKLGVEVAAASHGWRRSSNEFAARSGYVAEPSRHDSNDHELKLHLSQCLSLGARTGPGPSSVEGHLQHD
jgi:hypothetical protein